jgi:hypothetical protein
MCHKMKAQVTKQLNIGISVKILQKYMNTATLLMVLY